MICFGIAKFRFAKAKQGKVCSVKAEQGIERTCDGRGTLCIGRA